MDEDGDKRTRVKRSGEVELINNLPDCLLCQVLMNLSTKDVVKTSVLSTRWRNLWKYVPGLYLSNIDFPEYNTFLSFVDSFLDFNTELCLQKFKLKYDCDGEHDPETDLINRLINTVVKRKVKHIDVVDDSYGSWDLHLPPTLYTCESLVSLSLCGLTLPSPNPKLVSLPCLKVMDLVIAKFADELTLEKLISSCPVLETLVIERSFCDDIQVLRVRSQSLLKFIHIADGCEDLDEDDVVVIDAPRLEYLRLSDGRTASFILNNSASLVQVDIDTVFNLGYEKKFDPNDLPKRNMIRSFLGSISRIKDMIITSCTLEVIYNYSRCEPLPLFCNLSLLRFKFRDYSWEMLPIFLESCPNLKSLVVGSTRYVERERINTLSGPRCFLASLEYVEIERPLKGDANEMKLVRYLLENSTSLKKLTLRMDACMDASRKKEESAILKELLAIPRLSTSCQVVVL